MGDAKKRKVILKMNKCFRVPKTLFAQKIVVFILLDINEVEQKKPLFITLLYLYRKQKKWKQKFPPDP